MAQAVETARREPLTRARILEAATGVMDADWLERLRDLALAYRRLLLAHANVLSLFAEHRHLDPDCLQPIELTLEALRSGGLSVEETTTAYHMLVGYVQGHAMLEIAGLMSGDPGPEHTAEHDAFLRMLPSVLFPLSVAMLPHLKECVHEAVFELAL